MITNLAKRGARFATILAIGATFLACDSNAPTEATESHKSPSARTNAALLKTLADPNASGEARLASIHDARDQQVREAIPPLQKLLQHDDPTLVVAAAAALDGLDAEDADLALIEAAGQLGRARQFEHLRQLLYIIGNIGGPRAHTYLKTVAEGHELRPIRDTAAQILEDAPQN